MIGPTDTTTCWLSAINGRRTLADSALLFAFSFAVFGIFRDTLPINGDTYAYADSLTSFAGPVIHYGYFVIGYFVKALLSGIGSSSLQIVTWMSIVSGSLCVACMYLFTFRLTGDRFQSALAAVILMFSGVFWFFSEHGEVYVPQLCLILLSLVFISLGWPFVSCIFALIAVSVTPTSCLAFAPVLFIGLQSGLNKKQIVRRFVLPALGAFVFLMALKYSEVIGILKWAIYSPKVFFDNMSASRGLFLALYQFLIVYLKPFNLFFFGAVCGTVFLWRENRRLFFIALAFCVPYAAYVLNLGLLSGDHLIVTYIAVSLLASYGLSAVLTRLRTRAVGKAAISMSLVLVYATVSYAAFIGPELRDSRELRRVAASLGHRFGAHDIMLCEYNAGMAIWYLYRPEKNFYLLTGRPNNFLAENCPDKGACIDRLRGSFWINPPHFAGFLRQPVDVKDIFRHRPIYFVDRNDWPSGLARLLLPGAMIERRKQEIPQASKVKMDLEKALGKEVRLEKIIDSPLYPVYAATIDGDLP